MKTSYIIVFTFLLIGCNPHQEKKEVLIPKESQEKKVKIDTIIYPDLFSQIIKLKKQQIFYDNLSSFELMMEDKGYDLNCVYKDKNKSVFYYGHRAEGLILEDNELDLRIAVNDYSRQFTKKSIYYILWLTEYGCPKYGLMTGIKDSREPDVLLELEYDHDRWYKGRQISLNSERLINLEEINYSNIVKWDKLLKEKSYEYLGAPVSEHHLGYYPYLCK